MQKCLDRNCFDRQNRGCRNVTFTKDNLDALFYLGKEKFDLIFANIQMPNLDGRKFLHIKKEKGILTPLAFLIEDMNQMQSMIEEVKYIQKPLTITVIPH